MAPNRILFPIDISRQNSNFMGFASNVTRYVIQEDSKNSFKYIYIYLQSQQYYTNAFCKLVLDKQSLQVIYIFIYIYNLIPVIFIND